MMESEEIFSVIKCMKGSTTLNIYFTKNRIIVAQIGSNLGWTLAFGAVGGLIAQSSIDKKADKMSQLTPESILNSNKKNFEIRNNDITEIGIKKPGRLSAGKITILTNDKKYKYIFKDKNEFSNNIDLIDKVYGTKINYL